MAWLSLRTGSVTRTDWSNPELLLGCDPYLVWFDLTHQFGGSSLADDTRLDILLELPPEDPVLQKGEDALEWLKCTVSFLGRFPSPQPGDPKHPPVGGKDPADKKSRRVHRFLTGTVPASKLPLLVEAVSSTGQARKVLRFELATPRVSRYGTSQVQGLLTAASAKDCKALHAASNASTHGEALSHGKALLNPAPAVFIIDDGCNFASQPLVDVVQSIWHQGRTVPEPERTGLRPEQARDRADQHGWWEHHPHDGTKVPMDGQPPGLEHYGCTRHGAQGSSDESETYRLADYMHPAQHWTHGAAVLSAVTQAKAEPVVVDPDHSRRAQAPKAVHFVQLPDRSVLDTSGGSLAGFAIDGIHRAARVAGHSKPPHESVIVNMSYGTHSGPHDGSSMFERAMLEMLDIYDGSLPQRPKLHIVLPAGNSHLLRCYAGGWLGSSGSESAQHTLLWKVLPDDQTDNFIEIWFAAGTAVDVQVTPPGGEPSGWVKAGEGRNWLPKEGQQAVLAAALVYPKQVAQSTTSTMALLALAPTAQQAGFGVDNRLRVVNWAPLAKATKATSMQRPEMQAPAGVWKIELRNTGTAAAGFDAWVQRDDAAPGRPRYTRGYRGRQSYLLDTEGSGTGPRFTLNGIATAVHPGGRLWVVGAMDERGVLSRYAAAGPDRNVGARCDGPDVVTTVDRSRNQPGRHVGGVLSGSRLRLSGTSIGAAVFTRLLYHALRHGGPDWTFHPLPSDPPPKHRPVAGEPEHAPDELRGWYRRLRCLNDLSLPKRRS